MRDVGGLLLHVAVPMSAMPLAAAAVALPAPRASRAIGGRLCALLDDVRSDVERARRDDNLSLRGPSMPRSNRRQSSLHMSDLRIW